MKSRNTLIKLHRFRVDEAKTRLSGLEAMRAEMERKSAELDAHLSEEARRATESDIGRFAYPSFARSIKERKERLAQSISELERSIFEARIAVQDAYRELKKYEIAEEQRIAREAERLAKMEQNDADERAAQQFIRSSRNSVS
jgi:flagellar export protein FliJ